MRIAFLADIHGNLPALEAVVADMREQSPDAVYLVGDQINRCPWSNEVLDLVTEQEWPAIYGNHESVISRLDTAHTPPSLNNRERFADLWWTWERMTPPHLQLIRALPAELRIEEEGMAPIRIFHGIPGDPFSGFLAETAPGQMLDALSDVPESVVVCGHTHKPLHRKIGGWEVFNGGSVGMPYNGDPRAQYLLLSAQNFEWVADFRAVDYSWERVQRAFVESGFIRACGELAGLYLRTIMTGEPWASDFGQWLKHQPKELQNNLDRAVTMYITKHGPGNWAFVPE